MSQSIITELSKDAAGKILEYLSLNDSAQFARSCRAARGMVQAHRYYVYVEGTYCWGEYARRNCYYDNKRVTTKAGAVQEVEQLKKDEQVFHIRVSSWDDKWGEYQVVSEWWSKGSEAAWWNYATSRKEPERDVFGRLL